MKTKLICISACLGLVAGSAWAQEKRQLTMSGEGAKGKYVQQHIIDMDDVPGHQLRIYEVHRDYPTENGPVIEGEKVVEAWVRGFSNYTNGVGPVYGNTTFITDHCCPKQPGAGW
jgi:hypothetical protein